MALLASMDIFCNFSSYTWLFFFSNSEFHPGVNMKNRYVTQTCAFNILNCNRDAKYGKQKKFISIQMKLQMKFFVRNDNQVLRLFMDWIFAKF